MKRKVAFKTLGCRLNQFETDALVSKFNNAGYEVVNFSDDADVYVINSCTVTNQSDHKSRTMIHQASRHANHPMVVVTGCMANNFETQLRQQQHIALVVANEHKSQILSLVESHYQGAKPLMVDNRELFSYEVPKKSFHTRCAVKIQDGCDNFCTFCIIPQVRGRAVSRPLIQITDNIRKALDLGYKEMVITGVNIGRYQHNDTNFEQLVQQVLEVPGDFRVRISSLEPDGFGDRFIDLLQHPKTTPHLHLCLQSGSETVLRRMRRMYSVESFRSIIEKIRSNNPSFNLTTDIIVGFPGETETDFNLTCQAAEEFAFSHIHTFKYSIRDNTRAARMPEQVPEKVKTERSAMLRAISERNKLAYLTTFIGKEQTILTEKVKGNQASGYGENYVPVSFKGNNLQKNDFYKVTITGLEINGAMRLVGEIS